MPNTKISALTTATALAGTETLPVVQSTTTKKITVNKVIQDMDIVRFGRTTGVIDRLIDYNGDTVSGNTVVASWANLLSTYPAASNSGMSALVENAGNNEVGWPCEAYSNGVDWLPVNGEVVLYNQPHMVRVTAPATTFTRSVTNYTFSAGATAQETKITCVGVHGLTAANAVGSYIAITGNTTVGASVVSWALGLYKITAITLDTTGVDITVLRDYVVNLHQPTISLAGTDIEITRVKIPPMTDTGSLRWELIGKHFGTNSKELKVRFGDSGVAIGTASTVLTHTDTTGTTLASYSGIFNYDGVTNKNECNHNSTFVAGVGSGTGTPAVTTIQTNVTTDLIITGMVSVANDGLKLRKLLVRWNP